MYRRATYLSAGLVVLGALVFLSGIGWTVFTHSLLPGPDDTPAQRAAASGDSWIALWLVLAGVLVHLLGWMAGAATFVHWLVNGRRRRAAGFPVELK